MVESRIQEGQGLGDALVLGHGGQGVDEVGEHQHQIDHRQAAEVSDGIEVLGAPVDLAGKGTARDADGRCLAGRQIQAAQLRVDRQYHLDLVDRLDKAQVTGGALLNLSADLQQQLAGLALDIAQAGRQRSERCGDIDVVHAGLGQHIEALQIEAGPAATAAPVERQLKGGVDFHADIDLDRPVDGKAQLLGLRAEHHFSAGRELDLVVEGQAQTAIAHDHLECIGTGADGRQPVRLQVTEQAAQGGRIGLAVDRCGQVTRGACGVTEVSAGVVAQTQDAVGSDQLRQ